MRALSATDMLDLWERGRARSAAERALLMLEAALPRRSAGELGALSLGQRDRLLLRLRAAALGPRLAATTDCPACGEQLELETDCLALLAEAPDRAAGPRSLEVADHVVTYRLPDGRDAVAIASLRDADAARRELLARCVTGAAAPAGEVPPERLPAPVQSALAEAIARDDPQAETVLALACTSCATRWAAPLDVARFVWAEIAARARRLVLEVDALARAYGWREADVLALSDARRAAYLSLSA